MGFPTSDEDSSTPDPLHDEHFQTKMECFRPLTRIHLLLTKTTLEQYCSGPLFPTSDEDSSTPDHLVRAYEHHDVQFPTSDEDSSTPDCCRRGGIPTS